MRLVTTFSLQEGWRGQAQIAEFFVIPGEEGVGFRLVVNELPYSPYLAGRLCLGVAPNPITGQNGATFPQATVSPRSFVLADKLAFCRFSYLTASTDPANPGKPAAWGPVAAGGGWPAAVRVEMAPIEPDPSRLQPISVTAPVRLHRSPEIAYVDY